MLTHGHARRHRHTPEYSTWMNIRQRCFEPTTQHYDRYGGRGIVVCGRWRDSFADFYADMGPRPTGSTIDRVDNDGNYSCGHCDECAVNGWAENCRWSSRKSQIRNRAITKLVTFNGETLPMAEWAERYGLCYETLYKRIEGGCPVDQAITTPGNKIVRRGRRINAALLTCDGETLSIPEWSKRTGIHKFTLRSRLEHGWSHDRILKTPVKKQKNNRVPEAA